MRLVSAVLHLGKAKMEVVVQDVDGHRRRIDFQWSAKEVSDVPPDHWLSAVQGEIEFQRSEDLAEASGRKLPF
jgi:phenylpyruvate tautomerase PptA (4-oxalocrotonate tautomerase family)